MGTKNRNEDQREPDRVWGNRGMRGREWGLEVAALEGWRTGGEAGTAGGEPALVGRKGQRWEEGPVRRGLRGWQRN